MDLIGKSSNAEQKFALSVLSDKSKGITLELQVDPAQALLISLLMLTVAQAEGEFLQDYVAHRTEDRAEDSRLRLQDAQHRLIRQTSEMSRLPVHAASLACLGLPIH